MDDAVFDYIVIGAGSAGCVLANRLSANPAHRVCLIEGGVPEAQMNNGRPPVNRGEWQADRYRRRQLHH